MSKQESNVRKACEMAIKFAKTGDYEDMKKLNDFCNDNGVFMQEDNDRVCIEDDYFPYQFER